jgi:dTDP-4-amino-4,6-dideoxygalactose transaminase
METSRIEELISPATKAIVPVHYAGIACDMDSILELAKKYNLLVIEDAAQAIDSCYKGRPLGSIGHLSTFSFHETKNINSGEGGLLAINDERFLKRAEIIWEKGTNRAEFFRGEVNKYGWVDIGSSFLPSEIIAAYLWAQLEYIDEIQKKRISLWESYYQGLKDWAYREEIKLPVIPEYATNNGHMFYMVCKNHEQQQEIISKLRQHDILAVFHYLSLHNSDFYKNRYTGNSLPNSDRYSDCLVRLPLYFELSKDDINRIIEVLINIR